MAKSFEETLHLQAGSPTDPKVAVANAALWRRRSGSCDVLVTRRTPDAHLGGLRELPGGKLEPGESPEAVTPPGADRKSWGWPPTDSSHSWSFSTATRTGSSACTPMLGEVDDRFPDRELPEANGPITTAPVDHLRRTLRGTGGCG